MSDSSTLLSSLISDIIDGSVLKNANLSPLDRSHYRAAVNWMTRYQPPEDGSNLLKVRGFLEAFHHFCEVENWETASQIFFLELPPLLPDSLHRQLNVWGDYSSSIHLCQRIVGKLDDEFDAIALNTWGNSCNELARYQEAIDLYNRAFESAQQSDNPELAGGILIHLGSVYHDLGRYEQAQKYVEEGLTIATRWGNTPDRISALGNLGNIQSSLGHHRKAVKLYQQALKLLQKAKDLNTEVNLLGNLGGAYRELGDFSNAIKCLRRSLELAESSQDRAGECQALLNLANVYSDIKCQAFSCVATIRLAD